MSSNILAALSQAGGYCRADSDGDCTWEDCPQLKERQVSCPLWEKFKANHDDLDEW